MSRAREFLRMIEEASASDYQEMIRIYSSGKPGSLKDAQEIAQKLKDAGDLDQERMKDVLHILAQK